MRFFPLYQTSAPMSELNRTRTLPQRPSFELQIGFIPTLFIMEHPFQTHDIAQTERADRISLQTKIQVD